MFVLCWHLLQNQLLGSQHSQEYEVAVCFWFTYAAAVVLNLAQVLQAEGVLLPSKHKSRSAQAKPVKDAPMAVVGADNSGHVVMLKPHSRKRQAEGGNGSDEAALDTQQAEGQQAVAEGREQQGQGQDAELTLEQRVNALQLHQTPGAILSWAVLANAVLLLHCMYVVPMSTRLSKQLCFCFVLQ